MGAMAGQGDVASVTERVPEDPAGAPDAEPVSTVLDRAGDPTVREVPLPNRPESARLARGLTRAVLHQRWAAPAQVTEHTVLLVSELVGNAVRHTGAHTIGIRMLRRSGWIRVEVRDPSRGLPCLLPVGELDTSGRGLFLVDTLAERWGVDLLPRGKTTWFEMRAVE
ncbi:ATP-binding protein [Streptomyces albus subsp. chlorinus]|uniref:ATP-binding protein n=1 Tax=Streptomyces albus TaxID=1888 RepID=UPI001FAB4ACF|nr:ATP-binding protein [Streptomyces albus]